VCDLQERGCLGGTGGEGGGGEAEEGEAGEEEGEGKWKGKGGEHREVDGSGKGGGWGEVRRCGVLIGRQWLGDLLQGFWEVVELNSDEFLESKEVNQSAISFENSQLSRKVLRVIIDIYARKYKAYVPSLALRKDKLGLYMIRINRLHRESGGI
jgi:hypothetical protein